MIFEMPLFAAECLEGRILNIGVGNKHDAPKKKPLPAKGLRLFLVD